MAAAVSAEDNRPQMISLEKIYTSLYW